MTAAEPLTLPGRLTRLARRLRAVVEDNDRTPLAEFAQAVLNQVLPAVRAAEVQADEAEMLRAEAADRERSREALQSALGDLHHLTALIDATDPGALSKPWLVEHLRALTARAEESLKTERINHV